MHNSLRGCLYILQQTCIDEVTSSRVSVTNWPYTAGCIVLKARTKFRSWYAAHIFKLTFPRLLDVQRLSYWQRLYHNSTSLFYFCVNSFPSLFKNKLHRRQVVCRRNNERGVNTGSRWHVIHTRRLFFLESLARTPLTCTSSSSWVVTLAFNVMSSSRKQNDWFHSCPPPAVSAAALNEYELTHQQNEGWCCSSSSF